jgi:hypothetical protein
MNLSDVPRTRLASGASLGALLILLDLRPETVEDCCGTKALETAMERCLACPTHATCTRWMADAARRSDAWRSFCPNATVLALARPGMPRPGMPRRNGPQLPLRLAPPSSRKKAPVV